MADSDEFDGFEWDADKSARCYEERGFDFDYAARLFDSDFLQWEDVRRNWGERRFVSVGEIEGRVLAVVWTARDTRRRIISARPASKQEREALYEHRAAN